MDTFIDYKYIVQLGSYLTGFQKVGSNLWNFRCPLCGDSQKNIHKKRGYIYLKDNQYRFHCHNCGVDKSFSFFLKDVSIELFQEYRKESAFENIKQKPNFEQFKVKKPFKKVCSMKNLIKVSELQHDHPAYIYLVSRNVPLQSFDKVYWTEQFPSVVSELIPEKYKETKLPSTGIVFEVRSIDSNDYPIVGYQLRSIDPNCSKAHRFVNCCMDDQKGVFGINRIDRSKQVFVVEGPIDSLFLPNCVAAFNSSLWRVNIPDAIYINDCEPRNKSVTKQIKTCIDKGLKTVLLPEEYENMDINDIVSMFGYTQKQLIDLLTSYTFQGLTAKVKFAQWKK